jgi:outer membrane protein TolC
MHPNYKIFLILLVLLFAVLRESKAQDRPLTIQNAVNLALEKNRDLQVSNLENQKAAAGVREARGHALPTVAASAQYQYFFQKQVSFLPGSFIGLGDDQLAAIRVGGENAVVGGLNVSQPILQAGIRSGIRAARAAGQVTAAAGAEVRAAVITDVKKAYLDVLITQEKLRLQQQSIVRNEQALKDARSLLAQGRASRVDTLRAFVSLENLRPEVIRLTNGIEIAKTVLKRVIGLDESESITLQDSLRYDPAAPVRGTEGAYAQALAARPEVQRLALTEQWHAQRVAGQSAERLPKLWVVGSVLSQSQANNFRLGDYHWPVSSFAGLQLNVPIFSGFRTVAKVQQAQITRQQTEKQLENLRELVRAQVKVSTSGVEEARRRIEVQQQTVATAELGYRITRDRWKQGIASRLDVSDAELLLTQAKSNYLQAVYDYLTAGVALDQALGQTDSGWNR